ncbi:thioredoxin-dependent thiol peroxidase [Arthrobacter crystallopoietes]|uniref:thioredoxin-dependent thiol peroxidase n=1 Tax=Crystallibacter crystallopoietes TaxID=37928 RepID=UPI0011114859|nr:thioredoxin-dependent thiol peroxidase [Arthrobacter crystallopoietes]
MTQLQPGIPAPSFTLPDASGSKVSLADYAGRNVVVYFYPKAATPGCTTEACDFRDNLNSLQAAGFDVVGISPDEPEALQDFAEAESLTFPLLSDIDNEVAKAYGSFGEKEFNGKTFTGTLRSTVVVDPEGNVRLAEYNVDGKGHVARLRESLGVN